VLLAERDELALELRARLDARHRLHDRLDLLAEVLVRALPNTAASATDGA
jgi:hypothetical protein